MDILNQRVNRTKGSRRSAIITGVLALTLVLPISTSSLWSNASSQTEDKAKQEKAEKEKKKAEWEAMSEEEKAKLSEAAKQSGKPENIIEKIVAGQLKNFYKESVLVEQQFVVDDKKTVGEALKAEGLEAVGFTLWRLGEA